MAVEQMNIARPDVSLSFAIELALYFLTLFCLCMVCHGELVRLRPDPRHLTSFYLMISAGGRLGGMFVSLIAPNIFETFVEWRLGLMMGCLLAAWVVFEGQEPSFLQRRLAFIAPALLVSFVGLDYVPRYRAARDHQLFVNARTFYGVLSVQEHDVHNAAQHTRNLYNGRIVHGLQFVDENKRREPTAYYGRNAGVGQAFDSVAERENLRVGAIGLGVGTIAAYAKSGQTFRFYEINAEVLRFAEGYFTYLGDCRGSYQVVLGDARLSLEGEEPQEFDLLVLDAFSGDAVPTHLLTQEAFEIYRRHLRSDGIVAINISNRYLDLSLPVAGLANRFGFSTQRIISPGDAALGQFTADWMILRRAQSVATSTPRSSVAGENVLWTDDHCNLFEILK